MINLNDCYGIMRLKADPEEMIAAITRFQNRRTNTRGAPQRTPPQTAVADRQGKTDRPPRRCANCGETHVELKCPHPEVARDKRKCWTCGKENHSSRDCPDKAKRAIKAIEDAPTIPFFGSLVGAVYDEDGFTKAKKTFRPSPTPFTVADFPVKHLNSFGKLSGQSKARKHGSKLDTEHQPIKNDGAILKARITRKTPEEDKELDETVSFILSDGKKASADNGTSRLPV